MSVGRNPTGYKTHTHTRILKRVLNIQDVRIKVASNWNTIDLVAGSCEEYNEPLGS